MAFLRAIPHQSATYWADPVNQDSPSCENP